MARLPQPGGDTGNWGEILNDFLSQAHNSDGSLRDGSVKSNAIASGAVTIGALGGTGVSDGQIIVADAGSPSGFSWMTGSGSGVSQVTMAGDVQGQSNSNVISDGAITTSKIADSSVTNAKLEDGSVDSTKLANGAVVAAAIANGTITSDKFNTSGAPSTNDVLSWNGTQLAWSAGSGGGSGVTSLSGDVTGNASGSSIATSITDGAVATGKLADNSVTSAKLANGSVVTAALLDSSVTEPKLAINNAPSTNSVLAWDGAAMTWVAPSATSANLDDLTDVNAPAPTSGQVLAFDSGSGQWISSTVSSTTVNDATTTTKGIVQLAGDLGGTSAAPTVPGLASRALTSRQIATTGSLTGGGNLTADRSLSLVNDSASPGADRYYGTDSGGTKGYFALPAGGGGSVTLAGDVAGPSSATVIGNNAVTTAKIQAGAVTPGKISSTGAISGQVLAYNGTAVAWTTPAAGGSSTWNNRTTTTAITAANNDWIFANPNTASITVTLPAPTAGARVRVKRTVGSSNSIIVAAPSGSQIDNGEPTSTTVNGGFMCVQYEADGSNWWAVGSF